MTNQNKEIIFTSNLKISVKNSEHRFRGVYANSRIESNEIIERCPMIPLSFRSRYHYDPQIWQYCYSSQKCECKECQTHGFVFYMILGYGMIYNHNENHNAEIQINYENLYMDIISKNIIEPDQEIFVNFDVKAFLNKNEIGNI